MNLEKSINKTYRYQELADKITRLIDNGTFKPGDRIPSIREFSRQSLASVNTIKQAYWLLEDQRLIEARPQSGYYVCSRLLDIPKEVKISHAQLNPLSINPSNMVVRIMRDVHDPNKVQFGAAIPHPQHIPTKKLSRILAAENRNNYRQSASYAMPPGNKKLRIQIARWMLKAGCALNPEEVLITSGASEAVFLALQTVCNHGDTVAIASPIYFNFVQMLRLLNLKVIEIPNSPTEGINLQLLGHALKNNTIACCLVISNYDNPLGSCLSDSKKQHLVELLASHQVPLIEDDLNGDLPHGPERPSVAKAWDKEDMVILCSSFSKTIAPGYRVGWAAPGRFMNDMMQRKISSNIASASPTQLAIAEFLQNGGYLHHLRSIRKAYAEKLTRMADAVGENFPPGTRITHPKGGFTLWVELPEPVDTVELYAQAEQYNITFAPGRVFSLTEQYNHCLRLNGAFWSEDTRWAIEVLGKMASSL